MDESVVVVSKTDSVLDSVVVNGVVLVVVVSCDGEVDSAVVTGAVFPDGGDSPPSSPVPKLPIRPKTPCIRRKKVSLQTAVKCIILKPTNLYNTLYNIWFSTT